MLMKLTNLALAVALLGVCEAEAAVEQKSKPLLARKALATQAEHEAELNDAEGPSSQDTAPKRLLGGWAHHHHLYEVVGLDTYPGYLPIGVWHKPRGSIRVEQRGMDTVMTFHLRNLEPSTFGGIHVHTGTACCVGTPTDCPDGTVDDGTTPHYWRATAPGGVTLPDPWTSNSPNDRRKAIWRSDADGRSIRRIQALTCLGENNLKGNTVVIHAASGARIACGVLQETVPEGWRDPMKVQDFVPYPAYTLPTGAISPVGAGVGANSRVLIKTRVNENGFHEQQFCFFLKGVGQSTNTVTKIGGIHIHSGDDCGAHATIGGHHWNDAAAPVGLGTNDQWIPVRWQSDTQGNTGFTQCWNVQTDLAAPDIVGRVVVVHEAENFTLQPARIACGKIQAQR